MGAPIRWGDRFVGVLELCSDTPGFFTADDANLMGLFATQAAIAVKNAGLLAQVRQDADIHATLLNDVNHRVKNNLLRLIEIVRLQRKHAHSSEPGLAAALADFEDRLRGMAIVHTMLSTARWNPLPLNELVTQIILAALSGSPARDRIRVSFATPTEPIQVVPEQATAVALILNELATNSVKYAFRDRDGGALEVRLDTEFGRGTRPLVRLSYRDDGPGWPEAVLRGEAGAVGLHLIRSSVRSPLRGNLALRNEHGAVAELAFQLALPG
jgi:two-component sensor histidine kinase